MAKILTDAEKNKKRHILYFYKNRVSVKEVAEFLGMSTNSVGTAFYALKSIGVQKRQHDLAKIAKTGEIAFLPENPTDTLNFGL